MQLQNGRPTDTTGRLDKEIRTYDFLDKLGIEYQRIDHEAAFTMEVCEEIDKTLGATICKNLFLCNRQKTDFYLLTPVSDIAVLMDVDERRLREIISDKSHPASIAYRKGKAERALQIRQNELELAEAGSPLAVQLVGSYIRHMDSDEDL